ncbi:unnamed protein product [Paramecium octaurelia]|uniref:Vps72/YL1 C-terminal domain-containing protein n=1 Tax=Paramecium octaurelia TaxID=43137 RepID=A0A8S1UJA7_PAROT|nr:unnamed protein product [Paramecium octaurelia]
MSRNHKKQEQNIEPAIKQMEFRKRRGEKMNYLMKRELPEEDDFWNNNKYFNQDNIDDDESYQQKENQKEDSFDSDFIDSSDSEESEEDNQSHKSTTKKVDKEKTRVIRSVSKTSYIHDHFNQEYLIREAVQTELRNKVSLQYLIQIEEDKKKIKVERENVIDGPIIRQLDNQNEKTLQFINFEKGEYPQLFLNNCKKNEKSQKTKYKDPQTGIGFSTIQEFKAIKRQNKIQDKINQLVKQMNS